MVELFCKNSSQLLVVSNVFQKKTNPPRVYSRTLLGSIIAPNLVPWVLEKLFLLEIVKIDICSGGASKQIPLFQKNVPPKNAPMPSMSRIGSTSIDLCLCSKNASVACKEKRSKLLYYIVSYNFYAFLTFPFFHCTKFCSGCFRQVFLI